MRSRVSGLTDIAPVCPNPSKPQPAHALAFIVYNGAMTRAEKAIRIHGILDDLYPTTPIPLDHTDPFTLLVAVLLSAQTTDARVNLVTPGLFAKGPTPSKMAALSEAEILEAIKTCGLAPRKSKAVKKLSSILLDEHDGQQLPDLSGKDGEGSTPTPESTQVASLDASAKPGILPELEMGSNGKGDGETHYAGLLATSARSPCVVHAVPSDD